MEMKNEGVCRFCLKTYSGRGMTRHLTTCKAKAKHDAQAVAASRRTERIFHLKLVGGKPYWLHLEVPSRSTLEELDGFLRNIWLECCGHLSEFILPQDRGLRWMPFDVEPETASMEVRLESVLDVKDTFEHVYDFGTSTVLRGTVHAERNGAAGAGISILARNSPPVYPCAECGEHSGTICQECFCALCPECVEDHPCDADMLMPLVNSPRTGECAYSGELDSDDFLDRMERGEVRPAG